jgi:perosamine synthetase
MPTKNVTREIPYHRACVGEEEAAAVGEVIRSGWLTMGARTLEFERQFATYVGSSHAVAVSSCTAALHLALEAIGLKPGDEVLLPTTTFAATAEVVVYLGGRPVFVDIDPVTINLDLEDARTRMTQQTRAIIPVHLAGQPCDMNEICGFAQAHYLRVIEDAAHALPATYRNKKIGSIGDLTAFSFYATKTLTTGEGGMVATDNDDFAQRIRMMRLHGISRDAWNRYSSEGNWYYEVEEAGYKYNMTDLQAAIGLVQLSKCDAMYGARRRIAERYTSGFRNVEAVQVPITYPDRESAWHLYILRLRLGALTIDRGRFIEELKALGIGTSVHFIPLHLHPLYQRKYGYRRGDFPRAEGEYERCISLPIYPELSDEEIDYVISSVKDVCHRSAA